MHYYQFNIGDYASHTRHLEPIEDLIYRRLLDLYYLHERPLNDDATTVAKQIGLRDEAATVLEILNQFFDPSPEGYRSARADREIAHYHSKIEQASRAGRASAQRRINARSTDVQPTNNQEPITNNQEPRKKTPPKPPAQAPGAGEGFAKFWESWPRSERKQDKVKCEQKWRRDRLDDKIEEILADVERKKESQKWRDGYIEAPLVYLNGKRWMDDTAVEDRSSMFAGLI